MKYQYFKPSAKQVDEQWSAQGKLYKCVDDNHFDELPVALKGLFASKKEADQQFVDYYLSQGLKPWLGQCMD